jgi:ATP-binding cassette subfamily C (CFTR/MRP) protein 1
MCLFRIAELSKGRILFDDVDTTNMTLHELRSCVEIIPQVPVLFKGTLRMYLDPFNEYVDEMIWAALHKAQLGHKFSNGAGEGLNFVIEENGNNVSVGERQLLVMAKALLRRAKILVMDEATASVDYETEARIQKVLKTEFEKSTVFCIAHR